MVLRKSAPSSHGDGPVRTCVGCRKRDLARNLVRVTAQPAARGRALVIDGSGSLPGRGAWLHRGDCVALAVRRRAFGPALRVREMIVDPDDLDGQIAEITH